MKNKLIKLGLGLGLVFTQASTVLAQSINLPQPALVPFTNIGSLITAGVGLILIIATILAFLYLVWGGVEWITSGGDKAGLEAARNRITNAFIGLIIVFSAWAIILLVQQFFGVKFIGENIIIPSVK
ncbi:MAG: hypothetical protein V1858_01665 [Candidatus Gottesmanbacteria bacterium]